MTNHAADRNLLFGILALQMDFVSRKALIEGMQWWLLEKHRTLGELFVERGVMSPENVRLLEPLVDAHVAQHGGEVKKCLASVSSDGGLAVGLAEVDDDDLQASLGLLPDPAFEPHEAGLPSMASAPDDTDDPPGTPAEPSVNRADAEGLHTLEEAPVPTQRFRVLRPHAEGGLGRVHVALDHELNREVAFKEIKPRYARRIEAQSRFVVEAEITGGLEHPGIVPVYGLGHYTDGRPFYAMRFIRGESLHDAVREFHRTDEPGRTDGRDQKRDFTGLAFRNLINRLVDVCNAIDYAHSRQVLHRDLKPGNIMLGKYGETLVVDWGLAKPTSVEISPEQSHAEGMPVVPASGSHVAPEVAGQAIGTPAYMPPEQATGRLDQLGPGSDVYSLGATLYEILTGQPPLKGLKLTEILGRVQRGDIPEPRRINPEIPAPLNAVCRKAMALNVEDRYAAAHDLATELESWLADEPVQAFHEPLALRARRWVRRHPVVVSTTAACVLMALAGLSVVSAVKTHSNQQLAEKNTSLDQLNQELHETNDALQTSNENERQSRQLAEAAQARAEKERAAARVAANKALEATKKARASAVVATAKTNEARQKLVDQFIGRGQLELDAGRIQKAATFMAAAFVEQNNLPLPMRGIGRGAQLELVLEQSLRQLESRQGQLPGHTSAIQSLRFSEDGQWLLTASSDETCKLWSWPGRTLERSFDDHTDTVTNALFLDDGRFVTTSLDSSARIRLVDAEGQGGEPVSFGQHSGGITAAAVAADGRILTGCRHGDLYLWSASGNEPISLKGHGAAIRHVAISPSGLRAVSVDEEGGCRLWNLTDQSVQDVSQEVEFVVTSATFNFSGDVLVVSGDGGEVAFRNVSKNALIASHAGHTKACTRIVVQKDSPRVASLGEDGQVVVWDSTRGAVEQRIQLPEQAHGVRDAAFHDDGESLLTVDDAGYLRVWGTRHGRLRQEFRAHSVVASAVATHPDGRHVVTAGIDGALRSWQIRQPFEAAVLSSDDGVTWSEFSPDGKRYVTSHESGVSRIYDSGTHQLERELIHSSDDWNKQSHFSPGDGSRLLTIGGRMARLFDVATGELLWSLPEIDEDLVVSAAQFVARADAFVIALRTAVRVDSEGEGWYFWDLSQDHNDAVRSGLTGGIRQLQLSSDRQVLAALHGPSMGTIWRFESGDHRGVIKGRACAVISSTGEMMWGLNDGSLSSIRYDTVSEIARSVSDVGNPICAVTELHDGQHVVTGSNDGKVSIWNKEDCSLERQLESLSGEGDRYVTALTASPDSSMIAAGTFGGEFGLWEPESGELIAQWFADDVISAISFSLDASKLLVSSRDGTVRHVTIPRLEGSHFEVAARVWRLTQFEEVTGDVQYLEAVASLEQALQTATGSFEAPTGFRERDLRSLHESIRRNVRAGQLDEAAAQIQQALVSSDLTPDESISLRFLMARIQEKFSGLRRTVKGHDGAVYEIRIAPDRASFLTISADRTASLWSLPDARLLHTLSHDSMVWDGRFSPDGSRVAICGFDKDAYLWNSQTGELEQVLSGHRHRIADIGFSPDGTRLVTGSRDHTAILWDARSGERLFTLEGHSDYVLYARFDPTGQYVVTASIGDARPRVWDVETGALIAEIQLADAVDAELRVNKISFTQSGKVVAFPCDDGTVRLWNKDTQAVTTVSGHKGAVLDVAMAPDGSSCLSIGDDGTARVWDLEKDTPNQRHVLPHSDGEAVDSLRYLPDISRALTACGRNVRLWDTERGQLLSEFAGHEKPGVEIAILDDGQTVITGSWAGKVRLWSATEKHPSAPVRLPHRVTHSQPLGIDRLLTADESGHLELIDVRSGRPVSETSSPHASAAGFVWFSADNEHGNYAGATPEGKLLIGRCQKDALEEPRLVSADDQIIGKVAVSSDWSRLAAQVDERSISIWNPQSDAEPVTWDSGHEKISAISVSSDGRLVASAGKDVVRLWNSEDQTLIAEFQGHVQLVEAIAISSDGKRLVTGSRDQSARVWSVESQSVEHFFYGHTAAVREVAWDETERFVLTLSIDGQVLVWDSETGRRISRLRSSSEAILQAEFLHDSTLVATSTSSGAVRVWNAVTGNVIYTYSDTNLTTSTIHLLSDESTGAKSLLAVSKNGFIQQWPANIKERSMDDEQLGRSIQYMTSDDSDFE